MADNDRAAFITAALVLLVLPVAFTVGMGSSMLVLGMMGIEPFGREMLVAAAVWGVVLLFVVLLVARRLNRRSARS